MEDSKILPRFLDAEGKLAKMPSKHSNKLLALEYLAGKFESGTSYSEKEVNTILNDWHTFGDWATLRRALVDYGFMARDLNGTEYKLIN